MKPISLTVAPSRASTSGGMTVVTVSWPSASPNTTLARPSVSQPVTPGGGGGSAANGGASSSVSAAAG
jgi:hypothetical protein